ncbi:hypothetical protein [Escherichia coli]|uniref:hypothetical protein n=1 Tax=Escherichia coli TaxID=562 RepID=UPI0013658863|nr:hypothetical protein [Escherichia coli]MWT70739.1 hypothetical protein [Escherichia coli]
MDIEFSQVHEMVYMHDIANSNSKKKTRIPLKKFLNTEKVLVQTVSWALNSRYVNVNSVSKVNIKSKVKPSYISRSVNDEFSLTDDEINFFREQLIFSSIDSLSKLVLYNHLSVLFASTLRDNNRTKMNVEFDTLICTSC